MIGCVSQIGDNHLLVGFSARSFFYLETRVAKFDHKDILGMDQPTIEEVELALDTAVSMKEISERDIKKIIMVIRIQLERQGKRLVQGLREYATFFGLNKEVLKMPREDVMVMQPGPMNRGVEITPVVADGPGSFILDQVSNGVAVRMALLYLLLGGSRSDDVD